MIKVQHNVLAWDVCKNNTISAHQLYVKFPVLLRRFFRNAHGICRRQNLQQPETDDWFSPRIDLAPPFSIWSRWWLGIGVKGECLKMLFHLLWNLSMDAMSDQIDLSRGGCVSFQGYNHAVLIWFFNAQYGWPMMIYVSMPCDRKSVVSYIHMVWKWYVVGFHCLLASM